MSTFLMGLDAGGRSVRCSLVEAESGRVVESARTWGPVPAPQNGFFAFALDVDRCWRLAGEAAREVLLTAGAAPREVAGVAVTGMRFSLVVTAADGGVLLATPNRDARAAGEGVTCAHDHGPLFNRRTGHWPSPIFMGPRLCWLAGNAPRALADAACVSSLSDWLAYRLTGAHGTDLSQAGETLLFDLETRDWAWDLIDLLDIPRRLFPPARSSGALLGPLTPEAADHLGLLAGTPVAAGGADTQCGLLGLGVTEPGQVGVVAGSTTPVQLVTARPCPDPQARWWAGHHVVEGCWVLESNAGAMGDTLEWFARTLYPDSPFPVARFLADAEGVAPGAGGMVSSLGAQLMDAKDLSVPVGTLSLTHLDAGDGQGSGPGSGEGRGGSLNRAVLEGMAFAVRANAARLLEAAALPSADVRMAGGMTRSGLWPQLVCDVLGSPLLVSAAPGASGLGAAVCAGVAAGVFADLREGAAALARTSKLEPDVENAGTYAALFANWEHMRRVCAPADTVASEIALQAMMERREVGVPAAAAAEPGLRILVTAEMDESSLAELRELGDVTYACYRDALRLLTGDELADELRGYQVFVTEVDIVDVEALGSLPDLRVIAACRGNAVNVDLAACTALGIPVLHAPGRNAEAVADLALAFMLALSRRLTAADAFLRAPGGEAGDMGRMGQAHSEFQGRELGGMTVGLVGFGAVGVAVARRLRPFGARVLVHDPFVAPAAVYRSDAEPVALDELLRVSDIVSLHAPATDTTRGLLGPDEFALMRPGALLVNTARAALVQEDALVEALRSGRLGGAGLDVFAEEPPASDHPLLSLPNVIATPHLGGNTAEVAAHQGRIVAEDLRRMALGEPPRHVLNPETLADFSWEGERRVVPAETLAALAETSGPAVTDLPAPGLTLATHTTAPAQAPAPASSAYGPAPAPATPAPPPVPPASGPATPGLPAAQPSARTRMEEALRLFVARAPADTALRAFAAKRSVSSQYVTSDLGLEFHIGFRDGEVVAGLGAPAAPADVRLKAKAEILDAILSGRLNGNRAAMTGKLSFSGDVRLAMGMQKIQSDMVRLYSAARAEAGGIDFSAAPVEAAAVSEGTTPATAAAPDTAMGTATEAGPAAAAMPGDPAVGLAVGIGAGPAAAPATISLRDEVAATAEELFAAQLITATGGNVSARIPGIDQVWISPSQLFKGRLSPEMMVRIDLDGNALDPDAPAPSSERLVHCEIYRARPDVEAVVHAHAAYATILGLSGLPFLPVTTEAAFLADLPRVPFIMPGSEELAAAVRQALGGGAAVLLRNHGLVVAASSLRQAANTAEVIERVSQLIWSCYAVGKKPPTLPKDVLATLREIGRMMA